MNSKPILFSSEMVKAILEGRKKQTRRVIKLQDGSLADEYDIVKGEDNKAGVNYVMDFSRTFPMWKKRECPYGMTGDILWVRESWQAQNTSGLWWHEVSRNDRNLWNWAFTNPIEPAYEATPPRWIPSIHMPRMACRITLEILDVRIERVQDITPEDASAEGCYYDKAIEIPGEWSVVTQYRHLWDSINSSRGEGYCWDDNPWVWVITFKAAGL